VRAFKERQSRQSTAGAGAKAKEAQLAALLERSEAEAAKLRRALLTSQETGDASPEQLHRMELEARRAEEETRRLHNDRASALEEAKALVAAHKAEEEEASQRDERERQEESRELHDAMQAIVHQNLNARQLSYAPPSVFFSGLGTVIGRCGAAPGDDGHLIRLIHDEHTNAVDSQFLFESPNYLITTTSRIEYWAAKDPEAGLGLLGLGQYPKEMRPGVHSRNLRSPADFAPECEAMNAKLRAVGEPPHTAGRFRRPSIVHGANVPQV